MIKGGFAASCLLVFILSFTACDLETSGNGKLDGFWHLESIDTINGGFNDLSQRRLFWAFQAKLLELTDRDGLHPQCLMRFEQGGGVLKLSDPYLYDREGGEGDHPLTGPDYLVPFGVNGVSENFTIEKLTGSKMILNSGKLRLYFTKF
ncbi:hypothetical protein C7120_06815 [Prevotella sp. oral taxon 376]|nr:hypothetical protein C7120_06815 [Prevotella sp. oral taxon 376]